MSKIIVVGAGIIGLASAYFLRKKGLEVVLIDKGEPGSECSSGNMGWVCPSLSDPVPAPGLIKTSLKWMMKRDSPLYIKPSAAPSFLGWLLHFWKYCNESEYKNGFVASLELSRKTFTLFDEMKQEKSLQFEEHQKGLLFVFLDESHLEEKLESYRMAEKIGLPTPMLKTKKELLEMEPNLSDAVGGGLFLPAERHARPESFTKALTDWLVANDVEILSNQEVTNFIIDNGEVRGVKLGNETIEGEQFLITTGAWAGRMLEKVGIKIPLTAGKGYSITISSPSIQFTRPLYLGDSRVTVSPFNGFVRIGGTMELSGINTNFDHKRIEGLRRSTSKYLRFQVNGKEEVWTGMRPMTPDGLPVLGRLPELKNMYLATGHAMSGISMSLSTGSIMADLIATGESGMDLRSFSPERILATSTNNKSY